MRELPRRLEEPSVGVHRLATSPVVQFLEEFIAAAHLVSEKPLACPEIWRSTRRALLQRFPFGIYNRLTDDSAVVVAVLHGSRDPRHWKLRV